MRITILTVLFAVSSFIASAQCIAPFQDINNHVYVFDDGQSNFIEGLPLKNFKVGRANIFAYIGANDRLKVYYHGKTYTVNDNSANYFMTDNFFLYQNFNLIKVLWGNEFKTLEVNFREGTDSLYYCDSIIAWQNALGELNVFYNGQTQIIERTEVYRVKMQDNMMTYMDRNGNFKVFYHGEVKTLEVYEPVNYMPNRNLLSYIDQYGNFKFYMNGELKETMINAPNEYWSGEEFLAYYSVLRRLMVYYQGDETILVEDRPKMLLIKENIIAWVDKGNNFYCWYKGKKYWLERYAPQGWDADNDILVYQDINGRLKGFYYGEQVEVSDQIVKKFNLYNEAVTYSLQPFETKVWCNKKTYTFR